MTLRQRNKGRNGCKKWRMRDFDTSARSANGHVYTNCVCAIVALGILLAQACPAMPCIHLVNEILNLHVEGFLVTVVVRLGQWL